MANPPYRQAARALQGKTVTHDPDIVLDDGEHNSAEYFKSLLPKEPMHRNNINHEIMVYVSLQIAVLFHFGHFQKACDLTYPLLDRLEFLWSLRPKLMLRFYLSAALLRLRLDNPERPNYEKEMALVRECKQDHIDFCGAACDINYGAWSLTMEAMMKDVAGDFQGSIRSYEAALDYAVMYKWPVEEALILELEGDFLLRSGARTAARPILKRAVSSWNAISATGKAKQLYDKHKSLLHMGPSKQVDVGTQTVDSPLSIPLRRSTTTLDAHSPVITPSELGCKHSLLKSSSTDTWGSHTSKTPHHPSTPQDAEPPLDLGKDSKLPWLFETVLIFFFIRCSRSL